MFCQSSVKSYNTLALTSHYVTTRLGLFYVEILRPLVDVYKHDFQV